VTLVDEETGEKEEAIVGEMLAPLTADDTADESENAADEELGAAREEDDELDAGIIDASLDVVAGVGPPLRPTS